MINYLHERYPHRTYSDKTSFFENFLGTDRSVQIPIGNLQILATEILKINRDLAPTIFSEFFKKQSMQYNLRRALSCLGRKIWDIVPEELKDLSNISRRTKTINNLERLVKFFVSLILSSHKFVIHDQFIFYNVNDSLFCLFSFSNLLFSNFHSTRIKFRF